MQIHRVLRLTAVLAVIFSAIFLLILFRTNPIDQGYSILIYFFGSLFLALAGILVFPGYYFRLVTVKTRTPYVYYFSALRQAILLSVFVVGLLILKSTDSLTWWDGLLLFVALIFLEVFFRG